MTSGLIEKKDGQGTLAAIDHDTLSKLVMNGDLAQLTKEQKFEYYVYRCKAVGLDPATKPFDLLTLSGKQVLYATKECSSQLSHRDLLSAMVVTDGVVGDIYRVVARVTGPDGRSTDDMGCVTIKGLSGDALCNAMMKATTKAKRRAILTHVGLGMLDESEIETIPKQRTPAKVQEAPVSGEQPAAPEVVTATEPASDGNQEPLVTVDHSAEEDGKNLLARVVAKIIRISTKNGGSGKSAWTRYGVLVDWPEAGERWLNTFSATLGKVATELQGTEQSIVYSTQDYQGKLQYNLEGFDR